MGNTLCFKSENSVLLVQKNPPRKIEKNALKICQLVEEN